MNFLLVQSRLRLPPHAPFLLLTAFFCPRPCVSLAILPMCRSAPPAPPPDYRVNLLLFPFVSPPPQQVLPRGRRRPFFLDFPLSSPCRCGHPYRPSLFSPLLSDSHPRRTRRHVFGGGSTGHQSRRVPVKRWVVAARW